MTMPIISMERPRSYPPRVTAFTRRFWDNLQEGRFETTRCDECGKASFPPKPFCPHCWSKQIKWIALQTRGTLYSQTVVHASPAVFRAEAPYRVGVVDLDEGLRIATRIIAQDEPALDTVVEIVVLRYTDGPLFAARPVP
jgi:uncharacterized OB-fold protein